MSTVEPPGADVADVIVDVIVGTLGRAHGLLGEIFLNLSTDSPEQRFAQGSVVYADNRPYTVESLRQQGARPVLRLRGITDRTAAEAMVGKVLVAQVDESEIPEDEDEFYDHQLLGLTVVDPSGATLGTVARVDHLGFQDMLAVETDSGERLVPFVSALVPEVDLPHRRVVVTPIPGLLDDNAAVVAEGEDES